jgi:hypothetical protein
MAFMDLSGRHKSFSDLLKEVTGRKQTQQVKENLWEERKLSLEEALKRPEAQYKQEEADRFRSGLNKMLWRTNLTSDIDVAQAKRSYTADNTFEKRFRKERDLDAILNLAALGKAVGEVESGIKGKYLPESSYKDIGYSKTGSSMINTDTTDTTKPTVEDTSNTRAPIGLIPPETQSPAFDFTDPTGITSFVPTGAQSPWPRIEPNLRGYKKGKPALPPSISPPGNVGPYGNAWNRDLWDAYSKLEEE